MGGGNPGPRGGSKGSPRPFSPRARRSPIAGMRLMPLPAMRPGLSPSFRRERARRRSSVCRLRPFVCPRDLVEDLHVLGFERIGELADKPRAPLTLRFGPELGRCLDQAMGRASQPIDPVRSGDLIEVRRNFVEPIAAAETIARYTEKLVIKLCEALEAKGQGAKRK